MNRLIKSVVGLAAIFCVNVSGEAANIVANGGLEAWTSGVPNSFTNLVGTGTFTQVTSGVSPFSQFEPLGTSAAQIDPALNASHAGLGQNVAAQTGLVQAAVEFKFDTLPTNGEVYHWSYDNSASTAFRLSMGANFGKFTANTTGIVNILPITAGTWYQVVVDIDVTNQVISGGIRPFGGFFTTFSQPFSQSVSSITRVISPAKGFIAGASPNQAITFDNIYLGPQVIQIPEPGTMTLLGFGGLLWFVRRFRFTRGL